MLRLKLQIFIIVKTYSVHIPSPYRVILYVCEKEFNIKINKYTTYFSIDYQGDEYTQIFYGEQILKYNKHNLSKIYLNAIKNVKYNILQDDIVFNYLLIFLSKHTDLYGFFERSYIEHLNKLIFTEMTPPSD